MTTPLDERMIGLVGETAISDTQGSQTYWKTRIQE